MFELSTFLHRILIHRWSLPKDGQHQCMFCCGQEVAAKTGNAKAMFVEKLGRSSCFMSPNSGFGNHAFSAVTHKFFLPAARRPYKPDLWRPSFSLSSVSVFDFSEIEENSRYVWASLKTPKTKITWKKASANKIEGNPFMFGRLHQVKTHQKVQVIGPCLQVHQSCLHQESGPADHLKKLLGSSWGGFFLTDDQSQTELSNRTTAYLTSSTSLLHHTPSWM